MKINLTNIITSVFSKSFLSAKNGQFGFENKTFYICFDDKWVTPVPEPQDLLQTLSSIQEGGGSISRLTRENTKCHDEKMARSCHHKYSKEYQMTVEEGRKS